MMFSQKTIFHYENIVVPFDLTKLNALATLQQEMNDMFRVKLGQFVIVFLDEIHIYSRTLDQYGK